MNIIVTKNYEESAQLVAEQIGNLVFAKPKAVLGLATGGTAEQVYAQLIDFQKAKNISFQSVHTINLDEYLGLGPAHPQSYRYFMNNHFFNHIDIPLENTYIPKGDNPDPTAELEQFQKELDQKPRDFQLLGLGSNGHIAFNEPAPYLSADAHIVDIAKETIQANSRYFESKNDVPKQAFTQGMKDILMAKEIALIATGPTKVDAMRSLLLDGNISPDLPCSFLKLHPNVKIYIDVDLASQVSYKG